ncbi:MAG: UbiH/UbiF/VisC/COQ6 family ubiquinone biosynthesis hydroxylase [Acidiferrobacterales bacterium]|nr:UbiH/UbiF/VisC/COQ6 family ubiquinone biosynthesis hydroxylase [Acidiferrobacterales bacterium]
MNGPDYDIVVVGGGIAGLAFACVMRDSGLRILVLEAGEIPAFNPDEYDLRVNSINLGSQAFLDALDVWEPIAAKRAMPFSEIKVWDSSGSHVDFSAEDVGESELGYIVENNVLTTSLLEVLKRSPNCQLKTGMKLSLVESDSDIVWIGTGQTDRISCRLVVGADGADSMVRQLAGIQIAEQKSYDQRGIVAQVRATKPTKGISYQKFLPTGPLAFLPLSDGSLSIVWSCITARALELESMPVQEFEQELAQAFDYRLGEFRLLSRRVSFELRKLRTETYFKSRAVLIGDAAHVIHPLAGMGANLGLMDAAALFEVMNPLVTKGGDPWNYQGLRRYERWRKSVNSPTISLMDGFDRGFRSSSEKVRSLLGLGFSLTNQTRIAKQAIIRLACGLAGDIPEITKRA